MAIKMIYQMIMTIFSAIACIISFIPSLKDMTNIMIEALVILLTLVVMYDSYKKRKMSEIALFALRSICQTKII